jgi:hypothetical protein
MMRSNMHHNGDNSYPHRRRGSNASSSSRRSSAARRRRHGSQSSAQPLVNGTVHDGNPSMGVRGLSAHTFRLPMTTGGRALATATTASDSGVGDPLTTPRPLVTADPNAEAQRNLPTVRVDRGRIGNDAREPSAKAPATSTPVDTGISVMDIDLGGPPGHLAEYIEPEYSGNDEVGADLVFTGAHLNEYGPRF